MSLDPDAAALLRAVLDRPTDETPRLVLADYLDDTGTPADAAWAAYIRARCAAARLTAAFPRAALLREADAHTAGIAATLIIPAADFLRAPAAFRDLLPLDRLTVSLAGCVLPAAVVEVVPESVARTCRVVALTPWQDEGVLFLASADPDDADNRQRLEFILNREIVFIRAPADEIDRAIEASYPWEVESVEESLTYPPEES